MPLVANYCDTWCTSYKTKYTLHKQRFSRVLVFFITHSLIFCALLIAFFVTMFMNFPKVHMNGFRAIYLSILSVDRYRFFLVYPRFLMECLLDSRHDCRFSMSLLRGADSSIETEREKIVEQLKEAVDSW